MTKLVFLDAGTFYGHPNLGDLLTKYGEIDIYENTLQAEVVERIKEAEIVLTNKVVLDRNVFKNCPNLKLVCVTATGTNNIDHEAAHDYGVLVKNAAGYSTHSVAQTTLAMALHLLMQLDTHQRFVDNQYDTHPFFTNLHPGFSEIHGKKWGIIGLGNIGSQVAKIVSTMGAEVAYHSPSGRNLKNQYPHYPLAELLAISDIVSVHTPLNEYTKNLIGQKELAFCKPSAIIINVARGGIIDEAALAESLDSNIIAGAAVDVFSMEPIQKTNPLLHIKNRSRLILTPHIAWGSFEAREKLMAITCQNIESYLQTT